MSKIQEAMARVTADPSKVRMGRDKMYSTVASRVEALRAVYGEELSITTEILLHPELVKGAAENRDIIIMRACVLDSAGRTISVGHAEEIRGSSRMTETSALEICETSAIGRALASLGLHGGEYASVNEIEIANAKGAKIAGGGKPATNQPRDVFDAPDSGRGAGPVADGLRGKDKAAQHPDNAPGTNKGKPKPPSAAAGGDVVDLLEPDNVHAKQGTVPDGVPRVPPGLDSPQAHIGYETFRVFAKETDTVAELRRFWERNKLALDQLKSEAPDKYKLVRDLFVERENELKGGPSE